jgi:hypothetical protein
MFTIGVLWAGSARTSAHTASSGMRGVAGAACGQPKLRNLSRRASRTGKAAAHHQRPS